MVYIGIAIIQYSMYDGKKTSNAENVVTLFLSIFRRKSPALRLPLEAAGPASLITK